MRDLFSDLPPYQSHSDTSLEAAVMIEPRADTLRRVVFDFIKSRGDRGATDEEVQMSLAMNTSTQRPRRVELVEGGLVRDSGHRRLTRARRKAVVWIWTAEKK